MAEQEVRFRLKLLDSAFDRAVNNVATKFAKSFTEINSAIELASKGVAVFSRAVDGAAAALGRAVDESNKFAQATREVLTIANETELPLSRVEDLSRRLAITYGTAPTDQAKALYQAISAGSRDAAGTVDTANKLAVAGLADIEGTIDVLTTVTNAWGQENLTAARASDVLFGTVRLGKTRIDELASSFGVVAPLAAELGVSMEEVAAAVATLTLRGASTSEAFTQVRSILAAVTRQTAQSTKEAENLGVEFSVAALRSMGLVEFLKQIVESEGRTDSSLQRLLGRIEAVSGAVGLAANKGEDFQRVLDGVRDSAGATDRALQTIDDTLGRQIKKWEAAKTVALGALGDSITESEKLGRVLGDLTEELERGSRIWLEKGTGGKSALASFIDDAVDPTTRLGEKLNTALTALRGLMVAIPGIGLATEANLAAAGKAVEILNAKLAEGMVLPGGPTGTPFAKKTTVSATSENPILDFLLAAGTITPEQHAEMTGTFSGEVFGKGLLIEGKKPDKRRGRGGPRADFLFEQAAGEGANRARGRLEGEFGVRSEEDFEGLLERAADQQQARIKKNDEETQKLLAQADAKQSKIEARQQRRREKAWSRHFRRVANIAASGMATFITELVQGAVRGEADVGAAFQRFLSGMLTQIGQSWIALGSAQVAFAAASALAPSTWAMTGGPTGGAAAGAGMIAAGASLVVGGALVGAIGSGGGGSLSPRRPSTVDPRRSTGPTSNRRDAPFALDIGGSPQNTIVNVSINGVLPGTEGRVGRELIRILERANALQVVRA